MLDPEALVQIVEKRLIKELNDFLFQSNVCERNVSLDIARDDDTIEFYKKVLTRAGWKWNYIAARMGVNNGMGVNNVSPYLVIYQPEFFLNIETDKIIDRNIEVKSEELVVTPFELWKNFIKRVELKIQTIMLIPENQHNLYFGKNISIICNSLAHERAAFLFCASKHWIVTSKFENGKYVINLKGDHLIKTV